MDSNPQSDQIPAIVSQAQRDELNACLKDLGLDMTFGIQMIERSLIHPAMKINAMNALDCLREQTQMFMNSDAMKKTKLFDLQKDIHQTIQSFEPLALKPSPPDDGTETTEVKRTIITAFRLAIVSLNLVMFMRTVVDAEQAQPENN